MRKNNRVKLCPRVSAMDTTTTWMGCKCRTEIAESYKFCIGCADRNPRRGIDEVASEARKPQQTQGRQNNKSRDIEREKLKKEVCRKRKWKEE